MIPRVPNAKEGRQSVDFEIYGINGIPEEACAERAAKKARTSEANADSGNGASTAQEIPAADIAAPGQPPGAPGPGMPPQFNGQQQMHGMMFHGGPPGPGMGFHPMGQQGFHPGMMGQPPPGFNPMHGGPHMPPHMFGGPRGPNGQPFGGPMQGGFPRGPPPGPPGPPPRGLPPGAPPPGGAPPGPPPRGLVPPLFPAGAAAAQQRESPGLYNVGSGSQKLLRSSNTNLCMS